MILIVIGQHDSGKTHLVRALGNHANFEDSLDGLSYAQVLDQEPRILRDAGAGLIIVTLDPDDFQRHKPDFLALFDKWGEYKVVQVVMTVPFIPRAGQTW